jgi:hypothetical protein
MKASGVPTSTNSSWDGMIKRPGSVFNLEDHGPRALKADGVHNKLHRLKNMP